jgi:4-amino-4-deoxy-L-arabinose transferase-like glycosyltransferase
VPSGVIGLDINRETYIVLFLLCVMAVLMASSTIRESCTYDEPAHLGYGQRFLRADPTRNSAHDDSKMPVSALNALAYNLAGKAALVSPLSRLLDGFSEAVPKRFRNETVIKIRQHATLLAGRSVTIFFSLVLGFIVFRWSRKLYGSVAGLLSLLLYTFSPNIIAHSQLITTDLYATLMITLAMYSFWRFLRYGDWKNGLLSALLFGVSQLAKYSCLYLYIIGFLIVVIRYFQPARRAMVAGDGRKLLEYGKLFFGYLLLFAMVGLLVINAGFLFHGSFTPLKDYHFKSELFQGVQSEQALRHLPIPLPYPYLQGLDLVRFHEQTGKSFGNIYLLGEVRSLKGVESKGFKSYFLFAFLFKEPIAIQILLLLAIFDYILLWKRYTFVDNELFLLLPVAFFALYFSFFFKAQIGLRYLLVAFPLLYIFCGSVLKSVKRWSIGRRCAFALLPLWLIVSSTSYFPHYLAYFNEFLTDRKTAYRLLADSNVDWGQSSFYLYRYLEKYPDAYVEPAVPVSGRVVVGVNKLVGVLGSPENYKWLREHFEPIDHIGYSYIVYNTTGNQTSKP